MKRAQGAILLIGSSADCPDLEYASGFRAVDPVVFLRHRGRDFLVVPELEQGRAGRAGAKLTVLTPALLELPPARQRRLGEWAVRLLAREGVRAVRVPEFFPHGIARRLLASGVHVAVARARLFPERQVKTPAECRQIAEAQQAAVIAMRGAIALIAGADIDRSGHLRRGGKRLTAEAVKTAIMKMLLDHQCFCREPIVAGGAQAADPHETGHGPLRAHEPIVIDIFPQHSASGYWGDLTRTVVRGEAPPKLRRLYAAVRSAQAAALAAVRPGVRCATVHRAAARELDRRGFARRVVDGRPEGFIHSTGHGVGLAIHEAPALGSGPGRLRQGHVVTIEPGLYYPGVGGVRIEDTVVVTHDGWQYLIPCEKRFEV